MTGARTEQVGRAAGKRAPDWIIFQAPRGQGSGLHFLTYDSVGLEHLEGVLALAKTKRRGADDHLSVHFGRYNEGDNPWDAGFWQDRPALERGEFEQIRRRIVSSETGAELLSMNELYKQQYREVLKKPGRHIHFFSDSAKIFAPFRHEVFPILDQPTRRP